MGRRVITIPIHGRMLQGFIQEKFTMESFAQTMKVSRMTVHNWCTQGRIEPRRLSDAVKILDISADDVRLLERVELSVLEKKIASERKLRSALHEIHKILKEALEVNE